MKHELTDEVFNAVLEELKEIHDRKGADYGRAGDWYANLREAEKFGIAPWISAVLRGMDKMLRIQSFVIKGVLRNESLEDSLKDLANYAILSLILYRETKKKRGRSKGHIGTPGVELKRKATRKRNN